MFKKYAIIFLFLLVVVSKAHSVGLLTQYHLGSEFLKRQIYTEKDRNAFLLGVWFPGIWYVSQENKDRISLDISLESVSLEKDPFKQGILFNQYIHLLEYQYLYDSYFDSLLDGDLSFEIKECYLNILEDLFFCEEPFVKEAKKLLNETLYVDFNIENFTGGYDIADVIKWYFTVFISLDTHPLDIPDQMSLSNRFKGINVNISINNDILNEAKKALPTLASDEKLKELLSNYIVCVKHLIEESD